MAKTRRARIDAENGHRRVTRPRLRIIEAETQGYPTNYLRAPSSTIEYDYRSREVGHDEAITLNGSWLFHFAGEAIFLISTFVLIFFATPDRAQREQPIGGLGLCVRARVRSVWRVEV